MAELVPLLRVTHMTLTSWRKGSPARRPLPASVRRLAGKRANRVLIRADELADWLAEYRADLLDILPKEITDECGRDRSPDAVAQRGRAQAAI
jgi:hypothetical protein